MRAAGLLPFGSNSGGSAFLPIAVLLAQPPISVYLQYAFLDPGLLSPSGVATTNDLGLSPRT